MALDRARRHRRHRRLQGGRGRARAAEARPRRRRGDDALGAPVRRRGHVRGDHPAPVDHRPVRRPARTPTSSTSRSRPTSRCCSSRRRRRTSSASSRTASPTISSASLYLATRAPVLMAPAMNTNMLEHEAVQRNLADAGGARRAVRRSRRRLSRVRLDRQGPARRAGRRSSRPPSACSRRRGALLGRLVVVTAGPTYEDIDAVRYIGNRSSGRMGYAVAAEAARRGARVVLVSGPSRSTPPAGVELVRVRSAARDARGRAARTPRDADIVVMAAAVADYTPGARRRRARSRRATARSS